MQQSNAASLRFYSAFYHWSVLNSRSAANHGLARRLSRRQSSTATRPSQIRIRKGSSEGRVRDREMNKHRGNQADRESSASIINTGADAQKLHKAEIHSSQDRPFQTLEAWQFAVRCRSSNDVMVELAVPAKELGSAQEAWGEQLEGLGQTTGARLELRPSIDQDGQTGLQLMSALISGTYGSVETAMKQFQELESHAGNLILRVRRAMGLVQRVTGTESVPQKSSAELPQNKIPPWYFATRHRSNSQISIDLSLPWDVWTAFSEGQDLTAITELTGAIATSGSSFVYNGPGPETGSMIRCVSLIGTCSQVTQAKEVFESYKFESTSDVVVQSKPRRHLGLARDADVNSIVERLNLPSEACKHIVGSGAKRLFEISRRSGCHSIRFHNNASHGGKYVRIQGSREVVDKVKTLMQESFDFACSLGKLNPVSVHKAVIQPRDFVLPRTHFARIRLPYGQQLVGFVFGRSAKRLTTIQRNEDCKLTLEADTSDAGTIVHILGPSAAVKGCMRTFQSLVNVCCERDGLDTAPIEVLAEGELNAAIPSETGNVQAALQRRRDEQLKGVRGPQVITAAATAPALTFARARIDDESTKSVACEHGTPVQHGRTADEAQRRSPGATLPQRSGQAGIALSTDKLNGQDVERNDHTISPAEKQTPKEVADLLRPALRQFTHPVVVLTAFTQEAFAQDPDSRFLRARGVTMSSFNTVTLDPRPIVSFNLRIPSRTWDAIESSERANVHILMPSQAGAAVAHAFTQPYEDAHEPFERLLKMGARIRTTGTAAPAILLPGAVSAQLRLEIMKERCISVGDHLVVIAEVKQVENVAAIYPDSGALAYGMRGYRALGESIEPLELPKASAVNPDASAKLEEGRATGKGPEAETNVVEVEAGKMSKGHGAVNAVDALPTEQPVVDQAVQSDQEVFKDQDDDIEKSKADATNDYYEQISRQGYQTKKNLTNPAAQVTSQSEVALDENTRSCLNLLDHMPSESPRNEASTASPLSPNISADQHLRSDKQEVSTAESSPSQSTSSPEAGQIAPSLTTLASPPSQAPRNKSTGKHASRYAWGLAPRNRAYSTRVRLFRRAFATTSRRVTTDPAILKLTVEDFLCRTTDFPPRSKHLIRAKHEAADAARQLELALSEGTLTPEASAELEDTVTFNERKVAKAVALRSAKDLSLMLDKGKVNATRVQFLETSIERGQAVLLEEAKEARRRFDDLSWNAEDFHMAKKALETDHEKLNTALMRLRASADEEDD